jgi:hypothetical protein
MGLRAYHHLELHAISAAKSWRRAGMGGSHRLFHLELDPCCVSDHRVATDSHSRSTRVRLAHRFAEPLVFGTTDQGKIYIAPLDSLGEITLIS